MEEQKVKRERVLLREGNMRRDVDVVLGRVRLKPTSTPQHNTTQQKNQNANHPLFFFFLFRFALPPKKREKKLEKTHTPKTR